MSGLPRWIAPWLGACLSDFSSSSLSQAEFTDLWDRRVEGRVVPALEREVAWRELVHLAGETDSTVDMLNSHETRAEATATPSSVFQSSTPRHDCRDIHASKGVRRRSQVMLPPGAHVKPSAESGRKIAPG